MMIDLGRKASETMAVPSKQEKSRIYYPSIYIDKEIPLLDKDVGDEMTVICKLKLTSISQRENKKGNEYSCGFDVLKIDFAPKKSHYQR